MDSGIIDHLAHQNTEPGERVKIAVIVHKGLVDNVYASIPGVDVHVIDLDVFEDDQKQEKMEELQEAKIVKPDAKELDDIDRSTLPYQPY